MEEQVFTLYWLGNKKAELVFGTTIVEAITAAGYGAGKLSSLDFFTEGDTKNDYVYNLTEKKWEAKNIKKKRVINV